MTLERDYVLGTHDQEIQRLGLQHRVWRPRALEAWRRAGFGAGHTILDVGCGPGWAALDLAEIVGPSGRVHAFDRSRRFLDALESASRARGFENVVTHEQDLDEGELLFGDEEAGARAPDTRSSQRALADGAWCRWVFAFVQHPRELLARIARALRPGGALVLHEYIDYASWRLAPRSAEFEAFVRTVIESWRANGGEPDIGLELPAWMEGAGFTTVSARPFLDLAAPSDFLWQWPKAFVEVGLQRLVDLGRLTPERAVAVRAAFETAEGTPSTLMVNPAVVEIVATRR